MTETRAQGSPASRLARNLGDTRCFTYVAELVPWRGMLGDDAGARVRALASELGADGRFSALSITDSAGGHAMLSPEVLASQLTEAGQEVIVHVACRDRNRNELLSLGWRLASAGIDNLLVLSGDYPTEGYLGVARPVFDLDSVSLLALYEGLNHGEISRDVVGRPIPRDRARSVPALGPVRGNETAVGPRTSFFLGAAVNPFKRVERDLVPQYAKLAFKARVGARFAITQVGYDPRKLDELVRFVAETGLPLRLLANVFVLSRTTARIFHAGEIPGVAIPDALAERAEREGASADKGKAFFLELAAHQVAIARGLGYAGAYLGGTSRAQDLAAVLDRAASFGPDDWRTFVREDAWALPDTFYLYAPDRETGLNAPARAPRARPRRVPLAYRANRAIHALAFAPGSGGFRAAGRVYGAAERAHLGHVAHVAEQALRSRSSTAATAATARFRRSPISVPRASASRTSATGRAGGATTATARFRVAPASGPAPTSVSSPTARMSRCSIVRPRSPTTRSGARAPGRTPIWVATT